jgi:hypothetical protein
MTTYFRSKARKLEGYGRQQNWYGKAWLIEEYNETGEANGVKHLQSYNTLVATYNHNKRELTLTAAEHAYSKTTRRHLQSFIYHHCIGRYFDMTFAELWEHCASPELIGITLYTSLFPYPHGSSFNPAFPDTFIEKTASGAYSLNYKGKCIACIAMDGSFRAIDYSTEPTVTRKAINKRIGVFVGRYASYEVGRGTKEYHEEVEKGFMIDAEGLPVKPSEIARV